MGRRQAGEGCVMPWVMFCWKMHSWECYFDLYHLTKHKADRIQPFQVMLFANSSVQEWNMTKNVTLKL